MSLRPLPRSRLGNLVPSLVQSQALVALVAATGELRWAAEAAWDVARTAARDGRRVALVDLWVDAPLLHEVKGLTPGAGIVDAFESGASLTEAAQEVDGVFFIAAGSSTAAPEFLLAHPRWKKLQAGFRSEGALLLVFLSAGALSRFSATPDGVIALAPEGVDLLSPVARGLVAAQEDGATLLGVVRERWTPPPLSLPADVAPPQARRRWRPAATVAIAALAVLGGGWALANARASRTPSPGAVAPGGAAHTASSGARLAVPPAVAPAADSVPWTIQLAAYGTADKALALADRLADQHVTALVTPVVTPGKGTVWYRVLAGAFATRDGAVQGRDRLWEDGQAPRGEGDLLHAPLMLVLAAGVDLDSLRSRGIPVIRLAGDGRLVIGAYETSDQAGSLQQQLARAGLATSLIIRTEITP